MKTTRLLAVLATPWVLQAAAGEVQSQSICLRLDQSSSYGTGKF